MAKKKTTQKRKAPSTKKVQKPVRKAAKQQNAKASARTTAKTDSKTPTSSTQKADRIPIKRKGIFIQIAEKTAHWTGHPTAFLLAFSTVLVWGITGPVFDYSDTWQLVINTGTTIITFLMVFLIQNTQNRDTKAMHLKIDELLRATDGAHTVLMDMEELSEAELQTICDKYQHIAQEARKRLRNGGDDTNMPEVILDPDIGT